MAHLFLKQKSEGLIASVWGCISLFIFFWKDEGDWITCNIYSESLSQ